MPEREGVKDTQRLDKWLWHARIVKTRSLASQLVSKGKVRVNREKVVKPAYLIKCGDVITTAVSGRVRVLQIIGFSGRRGPTAEAQSLYVDMTPPNPDAAKAGETLPHQAGDDLNEFGEGSSL